MNKFLVMRKIFGSVIFLAGIILIIHSQTGITGALVGVGEGSFSFFIGAVILIAGIIIFSTASTYHPSSLEQKTISLTSSIKEYPSLVRLTKDATRDEAVEREMNHLINELSRGNFEAGLGHPGHIEGTSIHYLRGRNGARLYYQRTGEKKFNVVAKSSKGKNQEQVISKLKEIY